MFGLNILDTIAGGVSEHFKGKQEIKKAKQAAEIIKIQVQAEAMKAQVDLTKSAGAQNYDLDKIAMQNMEKSYKDELILLVFIVPVICAFIPNLAEHILNGFTVIAQMPEWYRYTLIGMIVVIYGMRGMLTKLLSLKKI